MYKNLTYKFDVQWQTFVQTLWFMVEIPTFRKALLLAWPATCVTTVLMSSCCFFAVNGTLCFVLYMSCVHNNFMAVS